MSSTETPTAPTRHYGDFSLFEDGIGIIRSYVDEFDRACAEGLASRAAAVIADSGARVRYVVGGAMQPFLDRMIAESPLAGIVEPLTVENAYFGGNVDVTGLLCACDVVEAVRAAREEDPRRSLFVVPRVMFNDDGVTLDGFTVEDMEKEAGVRMRVVSCNPLDYLNEIMTLV